MKAESGVNNGLVVIFVRGGSLARGREWDQTRVDGLVRGGEHWVEPEYGSCMQEREPDEQCGLVACKGAGRDGGSAMGFRSANCVVHGDKRAREEAYESETAKVAEKDEQEH